MIRLHLANDIRNGENKTAAEAAVFYICVRENLLHTIGNSALGQIVRGHLNFHFVAGQDTNVVLAHAA